MNAVTNPSAADARFVKTLLTRHHGDTRAALAEIRKLHDMGQYGQPWYAYQAAILADLRAHEITGRRQ